MTEQERLEAIPKLMDWQRQDATVKTVCQALLFASNLPGVGHLARLNPELFDELFEECEALRENED